MIKVVLDTNIFISSIFWKGASHKIAEMAIYKELEAVTSFEIIKELAKILKE